MSSRIEEAFREGFQSGFDHADQSWKYPDENGAWKVSEAARGRKRPRAMVLKWYPEHGQSFWIDLDTRCRTPAGLEKLLRRGVRRGEWAAWRIIDIRCEVFGNGPSD